MMSSSTPPTPKSDQTPSIDPHRNIHEEARSLRNIILKTAILLIVFNLLFAWIFPLKTLGRISLYNHVFSGRERLPYGDDPDLSYNLSLDNLEAMFASHKLAGIKKSSSEFRVILLGDSSTWGYFLKPGETLAANLDAAGAFLPDGRIIKVYNLGYPVMSLTKDLLILKYALRYKPDLIVWMLTLESFPRDKQLFPPLLQNNPQAVKDLIEEYQLPIDIDNAELKWLTKWDRTIIGARRQLADIIRLQLYGPMWAATGIDQYIPTVFEPPQADFDKDLSFHGLQPPQLQESDLALDVLEAGVKMTSPEKMIFINEPIFISQGKNSEIRYNFYYPRWAYDDYRKIMTNLTSEKGWIYYDFWDVVDSSQFSNTAVHLTPVGSHELSAYVLNVILDTVSSSHP